MNKHLDNNLIEKNSAKKTADVIYTFNSYMLNGKPLNLFL